jgi:thiol:disulfide interchange protein DsbA
MNHKQHFSFFGAFVRGLAVLGAVAAFMAGAGAQGLVEGQQFGRLRNPVPVETGKDIEVIQFFSYGCPHCGDLEPYLDTWLKTKPADVNFRRIPVSFQRSWENLSRIYYALEAMGAESKFSPQVFTAIHGGRINLADEKTFLDWAEGKGLDRTKLAELLKSFAVVGKVNRSKQLAGAYGIQSVPTVIIDGKFTTAPDRVANGHAGLPAVIDALVEKARAERPKS